MVKQQKMPTLNIEAIGRLLWETLYLTWTTDREIVNKVKEIHFNKKKITAFATTSHVYAFISISLFKLTCF